MRDRWLFAIAPYVAAAVAVTAMSARMAMAHAGESRSPRASDTARGSTMRIVWYCSLALLAMAHAAALLFPDAVMAWTRQEIRVIALELEGLAAGAIALGGTVVMLARMVRRRGTNVPSTVDAIAVTLVIVSMASGLLMAIVYRWASSWAEVTLVPYLLSVARLDPATGLVTRLPVLVKLHVGSAFVLIAIAPFTSLGARLASHAARLLRAPLRPAARLSPAWHTAERWTAARVRTSSAAIFGNGEEEN